MTTQAELLAETAHSVLKTLSLFAFINKQLSVTGRRHFYGPVASPQTMAYLLV